MNDTVLYNPHAGNGHGEENARKLEIILCDHEVTFQDMTKIDDYAAFLSTPPVDNRIILCGGDGTLNRFVNDTAGLCIRNPIFYFAGGSGNDFQRDVEQLYSEPLIPMERYLEALPQVTVQGKSFRFLNGIGYGIDGYCCEVGDQLRQTSKKQVNYTAVAIKGLLFFYRPTNAVVTVDGKRQCYQKVWLAPTMNGRYYGGGMMPTPAQDRLDETHCVSTMIFHGSGKLKTLMIFPSIFKGEHVKYSQQVSVLTGHHIVVEFDRPTPLQIDGETIRNVTRYEVCSDVKTAERSLA